MKRVCTKCKVSFPETEEYFHAYTSKHRDGTPFSGLKGICRECHKAKRRNDYQYKHGKPKRDVEEKVCCRCKQVKHRVKDFSQRKSKLKDGTIATYPDGACKKCKAKLAREKEAAKKADKKELRYANSSNKFGRPESSKNKMEKPIDEKWLVRGLVKPGLGCNSVIDQSCGVVR